MLLEWIRNTRRRLLVVLAMGSFMASCLPTTSRGELEGFPLRGSVVVRMQDRAYEQLIDEAVVNIQSADMQPVGGWQAFVSKDHQEIFLSNEFLSAQPNRTFELSLTDKNGGSSYYGKKVGVDVIERGRIVVLDVLPHKTTASLSLADILDPVPPGQTFDWTWTGDADGGGSQGSLRYVGDTLVIDSAARIHFTTQDSAFGDGSYVFRFKARALDFGWRIQDSTASAAGQGIRLSYDPVAAPNRIILARGNWAAQTTEFADSLEYTYEPDLWHVVQIIDSAGTLGVYFDGIKLDFFNARPASQYLSGLEPGGLGLGTRHSGLKATAVLGLREP